MGAILNAMKSKNPKSVDPSKSMALARPVTLLTNVDQLVKNANTVKLLGGIVGNLDAAKVTASPSKDEFQNQQE